MTMEPLKTVTLHVDADVIRAYAELSDDYNPIHIDPDFAAKTPMGGVIAHGTMSISLLYQALFSSLSADIADKLDLDIRFVRPVRIGETLTAGGTPNPEQPGVLDVWVRGDDGTDRVAGIVSLMAGKEAA